MQGEAVYLIVEGDQVTYGLRDLAGKVISLYACCVLVYMFLVV